MTVLRSQHMTARKPHRCEMCSLIVPPGDRYLRIVEVLSDNTLSSNAYCQVCQDLGRDLYKAGVYGEDDSGVECYPWLSDVDLDEVEEPELRARLIAWRERRRGEQP